MNLETFTALYETLLNYQSVGFTLTKSEVLLRDELTRLIQSYSRFTRITIDREIDKLQE